MVMMSSCTSTWFDMRRELTSVPLELLRSMSRVALPYEQRVMTADEIAVDADVVVLGAADQQSRVFECNFLERLTVQRQEQDRVQFAAGGWRFRCLDSFGARGHDRPLDHILAHRAVFGLGERQQRQPVDDAWPTTGRRVQLGAHFVGKNVLRVETAAGTHLGVDIAGGFVERQRRQVKTAGQAFRNEFHGGRGHDVFN